MRVIYGIYTIYSIFRYRIDTNRFRIWLNLGFIRDGCKEFDFKFCNIFSLTRLRLYLFALNTAENLGISEIEMLMS